MVVRSALVGLLAITFCSDVHSASVLWTTGAARTIDYQFIVFRTYSGFGYVSGNYDATMPQRWAAVPFRLDQPSHITELEAYYSNPNGYSTNVGFRIWNRTNLEAPTSIATAGNLGPYVSVANEELASSNPSLHVHQHPVDIELPAGDYYLSIFATGPAWIAWWTGGGLQDSSLESNFVWRSSGYPSPGFLPWTFTGSANLLTDPRDVYNLAFTLRGTALGSAGDFNLDGVVDGKDFLAWQCDPSIGNLADWQTNYGQPNGAIASSAVIPEPGTGALSVFLLPALACLVRIRLPRTLAGRILEPLPMQSSHV